MNELITNDNINNTTFELNKIIPDDIKDNILNDDEVKDVKYNVYRVAKTGKIEEDTFDSTYEEIKKEIIPCFNKKLEEIGTYSTSTHIDKRDSLKFLKLQKKKYSPPACLIYGEISYGKTRYIPEKTHNSHVDWWIFEGCKQKIIEENFFKICDEGDGNNE